jgi:hypothetical protein
VDLIPVVVCEIGQSSGVSSGVRVSCERVLDPEEALDWCSRGASAGAKVLEIRKAIEH